MEEQPPVQTTAEPVTQSVTQEASPVDIPPEPQEKSKKWPIILLVVLLVSVSITAAYFIYKYSQISKEPEEGVKPSPSAKVIQPSPSQEPTAGWKTFRSERYTFEFKYPKEWSIKEAATDVINIYNETNALIVSIGSVNFTIMGISYCGANPQDKPRCEALEVNRIPIGIDWGINGTANAMISISDEVGLSLTLHQVSSQTKLLFRQILSTFKFIDQNDDYRECIDSNEQCIGKADDTECTYGVWCDEEGRICGGQSCVGLGLGLCRANKCEMR